MPCPLKFAEFKLLSPGEQEKVIWQNSREIMQQTDAVYSYILYQLHDFYIEIVYSIPLQLILTILAYEDSERLDRYLNSIDIEEIIHNC